MNIGIFTETYSPQINGVVTSISILENELTKMGHTVYIFTPSDPRDKQKSHRVFRLPSFPFFFLPSFRIAFYYPPKLLLNLRKLELDIIHTQTEFPLGIFGMLVSEFYNLPHVHTYHTMYVDYVHYIANGHLLTPKAAKQYSRFFCNRAGIVVAPTEKAKLSLIEYGVARPIRVIPTGLDFSKFADAVCGEDEILGIKKRLGIADGERVIVTVCRIAKEKSIDFIINSLPRMIEKMPDLKFVIVGDGPYKGVLIELAEKLNVLSSVIFAGAVPWAEIAKYYRIGALYVSASVSETQGLTTVEAMSSKVPVAVRDDPSINGIVTNEVTGYVFGNEKDCADVILKALAADNTAIVENALQKIQKLSAANFTRDIEAVYNEAIENKPKKRLKIRLPKILTKMTGFVVDLRKGEPKDKGNDKCK